MSRKSILIFYAFLTFFSKEVSGQKFDSKFRIAGDSVLLRWYPENAAEWAEMLENGIVLQRRIVSDNVNTTEGNWFDLAVLKRKPGTFTQSYHISHPEAYLIDTCITPRMIDQGSLAAIKTHLEESKNIFLYSMLVIQSNYELAKDFALGFTDTHVMQNTIYQYRIFLSKSLQQSDTPMLQVNTALGFISQTPPKPSLIQKENNVLIICKRDALIGNYSSIFIEKSIDSGRYFIALNQKEIFTGLLINGEENIQLFDENVGTDALLIYRIRGHDQFSNEPYTGDTATIILKRNTRAFPQYLQVETLMDSALLKWDFPASEEENISGFKVYRSDSMDGFQHQVNDFQISPRSREVMIPGRYTSNYFFVSAISRDGQENISMPVLWQPVDSVPPGEPIIVSANIDTHGIVRVCWNRGLEEDLLGYQCYLSNSRISEFSNVSPRWTTDTFFTDTLDLGWQRDSVYYKIVSADIRYNESKASVIIAMAVPQKLAPQIPFIAAAYAKEQYVEIEWFPVSSPNVTCYEFYRREGTEEFVLLSKVKSEGDSANYLRDTKVKFNAMYTYKMCARNVNGMASGYSPEFVVYAGEMPFLPAIRFTEVFRDTASGHVAFVWEKPVYTAHHFRIIRISENRTITIGTVPGDVTYFKCYEKSKADGTYKIIAYSADGRRSVP